MATNNEKLHYLSTWDIDQLVTTDTVAVGSGVTPLYTIPSSLSLPTVPVYEVQFSPGTTGRWYQAGGYSTAGTVATFQNFRTYIQNGVIYINTSTNGIARYFVWSDKVDY